VNEKAAYEDFLRRKVPRAEVAGFEPPAPPHPSLFPHQRDIAQWACRGGRRAIFAAFGLGKTRINLQLARWVTEQTGGRFLIVAPLGVRQEFTKVDGPAMDVAIEYVRTNAEVEGSAARVLITNYERVRDGDIDVSQFAGAALDEAAVLRSYGSKTYQEFLRMFRAVPYRFVLTATPSPNRYKELIHYAAFLGVMDSGEALTRFFQRDSSQAGNLTLYPHMEGQFWAWVHSWAVFIQRPSDLGYSDEGYDLPPIEVVWHKLDVDHHQAWGQEDSWGQRQLFLDQASGLAETAATKRKSIDRRLERAAALIEVGGSDKHWLLWHDLEAEREAIQRRGISGLLCVWGSQELETREDRILGFARGEFRILATKPSIAGSGCNFQRHCSDAIFLGAGYKFADFIQAVHRIYRFQQRRPVTIHVVYLESESAVVEVLKRKWRQHEELTARMSAMLREHRLIADTTMQLTRTLGCERAEAHGKAFRMIRNDCVLELIETPDESVDLIVTSIPFGNQYEYSPSYNDFGHNTGDGPFFEQMGHLVPQLVRVLRPGRIAAIHVKDRIQFASVTGDGAPTVNPFSDKTTAAFLAAGFVLMARITIDTDVVRENAQTYRLSWSENAKDGTKMGAGMPEYVLVFRKRPSDLSDGYADKPVPKPKASYTRADWQMDAAGLWRSSGDRLPDPGILEAMTHQDLMRWWRRHCVSRAYSYREHVELAKTLEEKGRLPGSFMLFPPISRNPDVWTDISRMRTLNTEQSRKQEEMHVCPLQLDVVERLITRYSAPGETVLDPFGGIGTVPYQAVHMGRVGWGIELNEEYWRCAAGYCEMAEMERFAPTLFDMVKDGAEQQGPEEAAAA